MEIKNIAFILMVIIFCGCASYSVVPENISHYDKGVKIIDSAKANSKVQIEISQNSIGGVSKPPLVLYVGAQILKGKDVILDTTNLEASENNQTLHILTYEELIHSGYNFSDILQDFSIPTPVPNTTTNVIAPIFYFGRGGFLVYDMFFNPFIMGDIENQQIIQEQRQARKIMAANYLRKTTLSIESKAKGGFIAISPKTIKPGIIHLKVTLGEDIHEFDIAINKK